MRQEEESTLAQFNRAFSWPVVFFLAFAGAFAIGMMWNGIPPWYERVFGGYITWGTTLLGLFISQGLPPPSRPRETDWSRLGLMVIGMNFMAPMAAGMAAMLVEGGAEPAQPLPLGLPDDVLKHVAGGYMLLFPVLYLVSVLFASHRAKRGA